ncbi:MAG: hypothetical protein N2506_06885 [Dehalococcoidales bacterium]|nr:hypothetical protein [Dehalococcoidales bacterium]
MKQHAPGRPSRLVNSGQVPGRVALEAGDESCDSTPNNRLSAADTSHAVRNHLNIIIGLTQLLLDEVPGQINEEQRASLKHILESGYRLLEVVDGSRPSSGQAGV